VLQGLMAFCLFLIAASTVLLVVGWFNASTALIANSIGTLLGAAVALALAYLRGRKIVGRAGAPGGALEVDSAQPGVLATEPLRAALPEREVVESEPEVAQPPAVSDPTALPLPKGSTTPAKKTPAKKTTARSAGKVAPRSVAKKTTAKKTTAKKTTAKKTTAKQPPRVVVFPDRDKYHRPDCRYAKGRGAEKVTKATARRWGYEPCGVCNP
jgi:hypothetical protein